MDKIDFKKELKFLYNPSAKEVSIVDVPGMNFLLIEGEGAPSSQQYIDAVQTLYPLAYSLKFMVKKSKGVDYGVLPLEGLWWVQDMTQFSVDRKDKWRWTAMIMQPKYITQTDFKNVVEQGKQKNLPAIDKVQFELFHEGKAAQIMHLGPYSAEATNIQKLHETIKSNGQQLSGKHHEIYLNNPNKTTPEKLKTILRQPMK
ncbi:MAG: GyrI-like domain-containing protein [Nitrososphaerota archaeon]|nr:GyrI-like domain-containing protein [Nitrososphaerota archaeon]